MCVYVCVCVRVGTGVRRAGGRVGGLMNKWLVGQVSGRLVHVCVGITSVVPKGFSTTWISQDVSLLDGGAPATSTTPENSRIIRNSPDFFRTFSGHFPDFFRTRKLIIFNVLHTFPFWKKSGKSLEKTWRILEFSGVFWSFLEFSGVFLSFLEFSRESSSFLEFSGEFWRILERT